MNSTDISGKYYKLIGASPGCSWKELRKSYKSQIQRFHPDRYEEDSILKFDAEEHIKSLNMAYLYFQQYHKEHGCLPVQSNREYYTEDSKEEAFKFEPAEAPQNNSYIAPSRIKKYRPIFSGALIIGAFFTIAIFITPSLTETASEKKTSIMLNMNNAKTGSKKTLISEDKQNNSAASTKQLNESKTMNNSSALTPPENLFSYGSTMGEVMDAQGIPDKSIGDKWYYGKSIVNFNDGVVSSWIIHNDNPLNTTISIKTESHRNITY